MTNSDALSINISILVIGCKIDALMGSLTPEQKVIYKSIIEDKKQLIIDKLDKHLPKDKVAELLATLDAD